MTTLTAPAKRGTKGYRGVLVSVDMFDATGSVERIVDVVPKEQAKEVIDTNSPAHWAMIERVLAHVGLDPDLIDRWESDKRPRAKTIGNPNHPVRWTSKMTDAANVHKMWGITVTRLDGKKNIWAYFEEDTPDLGAWLAEQRSTKMAEAAGTTEKREKAPRPKPEPVTLKDLPLDNKPRHGIVLGGKTLEVKVFGKTHREMKNPDGPGRIEDPSKTRTPEDDVTLFKATAYQMDGNQPGIFKILTHNKATFVVGPHGVAILQTIRKTHREPWAALQEAVKKRAKGGVKVEAIT